MLVALSGTPKAIVDRLHAELKGIEAQPQFKVQVAKLGAVPIDTPSVAEMQAYVESEIVRWGKIVEKSGAAVDGSSINPLIGMHREMSGSNFRQAQAFASNSLRTQTFFIGSRKQ